MLVVMVAPTGWIELGDHLIKWHGLEDRLVDAADSDQLRRLHASLHRQRRHEPRRPHEHF